MVAKFEALTNCLQVPQRTAVAVGLSKFMAA